MPLNFDHVIIAVNDLDTAIQDYRDLGFTVVRGGIHANQATQNALVVFGDGTYLELLAKTGNPPIPDLIDFSALLQNGEGLVGYALRSDNIDRDVIRLRASGFEVGDSRYGERQRDDGKIIRWKLALVDNGFAPFLIEDVTPREWRIPNDANVTTHYNQAVGLKGVDIVVRSIEEMREKHIRLFDVVPRSGAANYRTVECVTLYEVSPTSELQDPNTLPSYLQMFAGSVPQAEIDTADPDAEPRMFRRMLEHEQEKLEEHRREIIKATAMKDLVREHDEGLFAVALVREQWGDELFTLQRTHHVWFRQFIGIPPFRGNDVLIGLDKVDWASVHHAYGPATDVPTLLREMASHNKAVRDYAYKHMANGNIIHQGTIYSASIETIPFLMQLLDAPDVEDKTHVLDLLEGVTFGGMGDSELRERTQTLLRDAFPIYLRNFDVSDAQMRSQIAVQLSLFNSELITLEPLLKEKIASDSSPHVRARCVSSLAELWLANQGEKTPPRLSSEQTTYMANLMRDASQMLAVQFGAAKILIGDNPSVWLDEGLDLFYKMMDNDLEMLKSLSEDWLGIIFHDVINTLKGYPDRVLRWVISQATHQQPDIRELVPNALQTLLRYHNQPVASMIEPVKSLLKDPSPDVRQSAVGFFYRQPYTIAIADLLNEMLTNDPSLHVRVVARNALSQLPKS